MLQLPHLSLYIHFPWCVKKCPYCDFNSHALKETLPAIKYLNKLQADLNIQKDHIQNRSIKSIFLGGGTPSLFPLAQLDELFNYLFKHLKIDSSCEITLEANPGTIERGLFEEYKKIGINRISLGIQSFQDKKLKKLGRIHDESQINQAIADLHKANISNFNIDLMHGLPDQTTNDALYDIEQALKCHPTHISWYQLTIEPNTKFHNSPPCLPNEDQLAEIEQEGKKVLAEDGFVQYETSAYSKSKWYQSKHNINYWNFGDYIGLGAGSHSKITYPKSNQIIRIWKHRHPKAYLEKNYSTQGQQIIHPKDRSYEFMINTLRLFDGFNINDFEIRTGLPRTSIENQLKLAQKKKLLMKKQDNCSDNIIYKPTHLGRLFLNDLINIFN